jgi:hypothetical protein
MKQAERDTPFYCRIVDLLGKAGLIAEGEIIESTLMDDGTIVLRYSGDQSDFEMPNWPYYSGGTKHITTGGGCPGAQTH